MATIGIVGGGIMGSGIAQVFAQNGYSVGLIEATPALCEKARGRIKQSIDRGIEKKSLSPSGKNKILKHIFISTDLIALKNAILVVEAIPENLKIKKTVFKQLDQILCSETILASNTSSISITELAKATRRPEKVIGMHFMNPAPAMPLIEIIVGKKTNKETLDKTLNLCKKLNKTAVISKDSPGFISNRILVPMINEAIFCLQEKVGTRDGIDAVMKLGMHHPMGPLQLADFIGLDTLLEISEVLHRGFKNPKYAPPKLLKQMVRKGTLGKKSGKGFYTYQEANKK